MSEPRNLTLERVNRLTQAMADLSESHAAQGRAVTRLLTQMNERLASIDTRLAGLAADVHALASEQILLGNRVEDAFTRALRVNTRLDEIEDKA
jgi:phage host-nuclease inhibitor protein Gam